MLDNQELFLLHWVTRKKTGKITNSTPYEKRPDFLHSCQEILDDLYFLGDTMTKSGKSDEVR